MAKIRDFRQVLIIFQRYFLLVFLLTTLGGCNNAVEDKKFATYIVTVKARKVLKPFSPVIVTPIPTFSYAENKDKRDPFKRGTAKDFADYDFKQSLAKFPLSELKLVGVLQNESTSWGLISSPNGTITRVKIGDFLGKNFSKIIFISSTFLTLEENNLSLKKVQKNIVYLPLKSENT